MAVAQRLVIAYISISQSPLPRLHRELGRSFGGRLSAAEEKFISGRCTIEGISMACDSRSAPFSPTNRPIKVIRGFWGSEVEPFAKLTPYCFCLPSSTVSGTE